MVLETVWCSKNNVWGCSMSNLVNLVTALLGSMWDFSSFEAKNRVFEVDHQWMNTFQFFRCLRNDVQISSMFNKSQCKIWKNMVWNWKWMGWLLTILLTLNFFPLFFLSTGSPQLCLIKDSLKWTKKIPHASNTLMSQTKDS